MISILMKDIIEEKNVKKIIDELNIKMNVEVLKEDLLDKLGNQKNEIIIMSYNKDYIEKCKKNTKNLIVYISKKNRNKIKDDTLYEKNIVTYSTKNELREILTYIYRKKEKKDATINFFKVSLSIVLIMTLVIGIKGISSNHNKNKITAKEPPAINKKEVVKSKLEEFKKNENIVFLGDSITELYNLRKFYPDLPVINSGTCGFQTTDIIDHLEDYVYVYNPTKIVLLIGTNDMVLSERNNDEILDNIIKIVSEIKKNRPKTQLFIESVYPVNNDESNEKIDPNMVRYEERTIEEIKDLNKKIKAYCEKENLQYINMYDKLTDENGLLKIDYTIEGLHINDEGYEVITSELNKILKIES